jgi:ABC-type oligopeptide transport system substrate-binding subunit
MTGNMTRRTLLAAGPAALASCGEGVYFGATTPPGRQQRVYANGNEPDIFDSGTYAGGTEMRIINALFDGLTKFHPVSLARMAALATHYEGNADATRFTFYLRGHPRPRGIQFPNTDDLPAEFSRGHKAPPDSVPARWSDGTFITAADFVYSWRRVLEPRTVSADYWTGKYPDPATFLDMFQSGSVQSGTGWVDPNFDSLLAAADKARDPTIRMLHLIECEKFLLASMPIIPIYFKVYSSLVKPYVRGWESNALNEHHFKYVWIDTNWKPT